MDERVTSIILAGGQGTRLYPLTKTRSKPAVPIGGKFRLIDIPISNCLHAGYRHIWIVTQFASESLHRHIFSTYRMDPFAKGFISILAASQTMENQSWYQGTADAVRKNLRFFSNAFPNILILSGDHLYRMDYRAFVNAHLETEADITIAVIPVQQERASELGILHLEEDFRIREFVEKPGKPDLIERLKIPEEVRNILKKEIGLQEDQTHLASMGIYVFKKEIMFELLEKTTFVDFGKEVIPHALEKYKVVAYPFNGYWEDIGTIGAFFQAHIGLTDQVPKFNFYDEDKPIYSHPRFLPAAKINEAEIQSSIIAEGVIIDHSKIVESVVGIRSVIRNNCHLERVIVMGNDYYESSQVDRRSRKRYQYPLGIGENCVIKNAILDKNVRIGDGVQLINKNQIQEGEFGDIVIRDGIIVVPKGTEVESGTVI